MGKSFSCRKKMSRQELERHLEEALRIVRLLKAERDRAVVMEFPSSDVRQVFEQAMFNFCKHQVVPFSPVTLRRFWACAQRLVDVNVNREELFATGKQEFNEDDRFITAAQTRSDWKKLTDDEKIEKTQEKRARMIGTLGTYTPAHQPFLIEDRRMILMSAAFVIAFYAFGFDEGHLCDNVIDNVVAIMNTHGPAKRGNKRLLLTMVRRLFESENFTPCLIETNDPLSAEELAEQEAYENEQRTPERILQLKEQEARETESLKELKARNNEFLRSMGETVYS